MGNKQHLVAVDNRTPMTFRWYNLESRQEAGFCEPGRIWLAHSGDDGDHGPAISDYDAKNPKEHCFQFEVLDGPKESVGKKFFLCKVGGDMKYFTEATQHSPKVVCSGIDDDHLQLNIVGGTVDQLRFSLQHQWWPEWRDQVGLAGIMNNTKHKVVVSQVQSDKPSSKTAYKIDEGSYGDYSKQRFGNGDYAHCGLLIPALESTHSLSVSISTSNNTHLWSGAIYFHQQNILMGRTFPAVQPPPNQPPGTGYALPIDRLPGGHSQKDSPLKYLDICGETAADFVIRMVERPSDLTPLLTDGHSLGPHANLLVTMDTDLLQNHKMNGAATAEYNTFVTRIKLTDREKTPLSDFDVTLHSNPAVKVTIDGQERMLNDPKFTVHTDLDGVITVTQEVDNNLGSVVFLLGITNTKVAHRAVTVEVHAGDKVSSRLQHLKTVQDWQKAKDRNGKPVFGDGKHIDANSVKVLKDVILMTAVPRAMNPIPLPNVEAPPEGGIIHNNLVDGASANLVAEPPHLASQPHSIPLVPLHRPSVAHLPKDYALVLDFKNRKIKSGVEAREHVAASRAPVNALHDHLNTGNSSTMMLAAGAGAPGTPSNPAPGLWERLWNLAKAAWNAVTDFVFEVVGEVLTLAINGFTYLVNCVAEAMSAIGAILEGFFAAAFDSVVNWLGELFDWTAIKKTYNVIYTVGDSSIKALKYGIHTAVGFLKGETTLDAAKKHLAGFQNDPSMKQTAGETATNPPRSKDGNMSSIGEAAKSPTFNWAFSAAKTEGDGTDSPIWTAVSFTEDDRFKTAMQHLADCSSLGDDIHDLATNWKQKSFPELVAGLLRAITGTIIKFKDALLDLLECVVDVALSLLDQMSKISCNIPLLATLWRTHILGNSKSAIKPNFMQMSSFILAIPTTYLAKLVSWAFEIDFLFNIDFVYPELTPVSFPDITSLLNDGVEAVPHANSVTDPMPSHVNAGVGNSLVLASDVSTSHTMVLTTQPATAIAQYVLGVVNCVAQLGSLLYYCAMETEKMFYMTALKPKLTLRAILTSMKLFCDVIATSAAIASSSIAVATHPPGETKWAKARKGMGLLITSLQTVVRFKDICKTYNAWTNKNVTTPPSWLPSQPLFGLSNETLALLETGTGLTAGVIAILYAVFYAKEVGPKDAIYKAIAGTKIPQVLLTCFYQDLATPRDTREITRRADPLQATPPTKLELDIVGVRIVLLTAALVCNATTTVCTIVAQSGDQGAV